MGLQALISLICPLTSLMLVRPRRKACLSEAQDERRTTESLLSLFGRDTPHICSTVWGGPDGGVHGPGLVLEEQRAVHHMDACTPMRFRIFI